MQRRREVRRVLPVDSRRDTRAGSRCVRAPSFGCFELLFDRDVLRDVRAVGSPRCTKAHTAVGGGVGPPQPAAARSASRYGKTEQATHGALQEVRRGGHGTPARGPVFPGCSSRCECRRPASMPSMQRGVGEFRTMGRCRRDRSTLGIECDQERAEVAGQCERGLGRAQSAPSRGVAARQENVDGARAESVRDLECTAHRHTSTRRSTMSERRRCVAMREPMREIDGESGAAPDSDARPAVSRRASVDGDDLGVTAARA